MSAGQFTHTNNFDKELLVPHLSHIEDAVVQHGVKRTFLSDSVVLKDGTKVSLDILSVDHRKIFPYMKYVIITALGYDLTPIGFRDISANHVSASHQRCFGSGSECIPHYLSKDWIDFDMGVPYRWFRLGELNRDCLGFMVLETHMSTGLDQALLYVGNEIAKRMNIKSHWLEGNF